MAGSRDHIHLLFSRQIDKFHRIAGHPDREIGILLFLGVLHGVDQFLSSEHIYVQVMRSLIKISVHYLDQIADPFLFRMSQSVRIDGLRIGDPVQCPLVGQLRHRIQRSQSAGNIPAGHGGELQWYRNDRETTRGATLVATEREGTLCYTIPADMPVGTYYYYCAVTTAREDNGEYARTYSDYIAVTIVNAKQAAPQAREGYAIDYREETVEIDDGYEIYTAKTGGIEISSGESISGYLGKAVYIRKAGMENYSPSDWTEFYIAPRRLAPPVSVQAETIQGKGDGVITGITEGMEYRRAGDADWTPGPAALTNLPAGARVQVRFSATDETPHGKSKLCVIAAGTETFTVTFDGQGGDAQPHKITGLAYNATLSAPAATRDGYTFTGWY